MTRRSALSRTLLAYGSGVLVGAACFVPAEMALGAIRSGGMLVADLSLFNVLLFAGLFDFCLILAIVGLPIHLAVLRWSRRPRRDATLLGMIAVIILSACIGLCVSLVMVRIAYPPRDHERLTVDG